jgi:mannose-6-phosphate isomerase-like protein (cupin superfamily)
MSWASSYGFTIIPSATSNAWPARAREVEAVLDGVRTAIRAGFAVVVPAGTNHDIINTGS